MSGVVNANAKEEERLEVTGKTVEEAKETALKLLGAEYDEVEFEILEAPTKGILGIGAKPAKVAAVKRFDVVKAAKQILREMTALMGLSVLVEVELDEKVLNVTVTGTDAHTLIGKHGQTLDAAQYLLSLAINRGDRPYVSVCLDTQGYRKKRRETLESLAFSIAKKVKTTKRAVRLEPMSANERRIIHSFLQNDRQIATHSEGEEPYRNIVVSYRRGEKRVGE